LVLVGVWRSLVAHLVWDQGVQGSNPCTPTKNSKKAHSVGFFYIWPLNTRFKILPVAQLDRASAF
jgi:hypothetical protein